MATAPREFRYSFADFQRSAPLWWLVGLFVVVVVAFGRWQGVQALGGLAASGAVLIAFLVPALLRDAPAVPVALAATAVIAFVALYLAHGVNAGTTVALAGTLVSLALTAGLAFAVAALAQFSGLADDRAQTLQITADALDLRGLLVAGIVVGALGVLDDVTVSQVSIVAALRRANPGLPPHLLYREATKVGRDHVASTVNTLMLAYVGASLPLLLFFVQGDQPVGRLLAGELIAVEIVRMLVGSIGLVASVPITTALAAVVLAPAGDVLGRRQRRRIGDDPVEDGGAVPPPTPCRHAGSGAAGRRVPRPAWTTWCRPRIPGERAGAPAARRGAGRAQARKHRGRGGGGGRARRRGPDRAAPGAGPEALARLAAASPRFRAVDAAWELWDPTGPRPPPCWPGPSSTGCSCGCCPSRC